MLKELQMNYLDKNKESQLMFRKLQAAINILNNKRTLFQISSSNSFNQDDILDTEEEKKEPKAFNLQPN